MTGRPGAAGTGLDRTSGCCGVVLRCSGEDVEPVVVADDVVHLLGLDASGEVDLAVHDALGVDSGSVTGRPSGPKIPDSALRLRASMSRTDCRRRRSRRSSPARSSRWRRPRRSCPRTRARRCGSRSRRPCRSPRARPAARCRTATCTCSPCASSAKRASVLVFSPQASTPRRPTRCRAPAASCRRRGPGELLGPRRHELAVHAEQLAGRGDGEDRVVEDAEAEPAALVDSDHDGDAVPPRSRAQLVDLGARARRSPRGTASRTTASPGPGSSSSSSRGSRARRPRGTRRATHRCPAASSIRSDGLARPWLSRRGTPGCAARQRR